MKITLSTTRAIRCEKFLREKLPFLRRSFLQKLFRKREIKVGNTARALDAKVSTGENITVFLPDPRKYFFDLTGNEILFEDGDVIAFNKRAGISTHAGVGTRGNDLRTAAEFLLKLKLIVVHRIDKATSGVIVFAKNQQTARTLEDEFRKRKVGKQYFVVVEGIPRAREGVIALRLKRKGKLMEIDKTGVEAETSWKLLTPEISRGRQKTALLEIEIKTGRMHQIRVHLSAIGHPVIGDELYGYDKSEKALFPRKRGRMLLHASKLKILDYEFEAKIPSEFQISNFKF
ncbi:MAG: RluA family pseudouridine synthase [Patescibacteria group bacterium]